MTAFQDSSHPSLEPRLEGAPNFRDLGGIRCVDGRRVKPGRVFRSEILSRLTDADLEALRGFGIDAVCDLRHGAERMRHVNRWPAGCAPKVIGLPPGEGLEAVQGNGTQSRIADPDFDLAEAKALLAAGYRRMPRSLAGSVAAVFDHLRQPDAAPLLIHCTSGKDRSGFVCAMLLTALRVPREAIVHDYLLSRERYPLDSIRQMLQKNLGALPPGRLDALVDIATVSADYLDAAFEQIRVEFGGVDAYLEMVAGLNAAARSGLRELLLQA
jgi:protein-tyrosine phosphatase